MQNFPYRLGIHILAGARGLSVSEHIDLIANVGWNGCTMKWNPDLTEKAANAAAKKGLYFQSLHAPFGQVDTMWKPGNASDLMKSRILGCLEDCARYDIPVMVIHSFIGFGVPYVPTAVGIENFRQIVEKAEDLGIKLAFENVEGEPYLDAILSEFRDSPFVGFCLDTGHGMCYNHGRDFLAEYGDRLFHTHLNDNLGQRGKDITFLDDLHLPMGDGIADWKEIMQKIRETGYRDMLICELNYSNKPDSHELDRYLAMEMEEFYAYALEAARCVTTL